MMVSLKEVVHIDHRFENAINLQLDYGHDEKITSYIPTLSSMKVMSKFLSNIVEETDERATLLVGPYGKGKSHLLFVLLYFLTAVTKGRRDILRGLVKKMDLVDEEVGQMFHLVLSRSICLLPVLVSSTREDLNQAFLIALHEALQREGLTHIRPNTFFDVAVKVILQWKKKYPSTYERLEVILKRRGKQMSVFVQQLRSFQANALDEFQKIYPMLTSGAVFNPMLHMQLLNIYKTVNHILCEQHGYQGIFIVFDEFNKFVEGHKQETIIKNIKTLQDMCEFANFSKKEQIHMVLVSHKSIQEYRNYLSMSVIHAFTGMEGRLSEVFFVTSAKNNYELIQNTIAVDKEKLDFLLEKNLVKINILKKMYYLPIFRNIFGEEDFYNKMIIGCFPLSPITAYFLIYISESVAQNERTLFTFLTKDGPYSLPRFVQEWTPETSCFITPDSVYDYFSSLFKKNKIDEEVYNSYLKAQYALKLTEDQIEKKLIKVLALFEMLGSKEELLARTENLAFSLLISAKKTSDCLDSLKEKQIIIKRNRTNTYVFKKNIGIDIEKEIEKIVVHSFRQPKLDQELEAISYLKYVFPRQYNQEYKMTRFFEYKFLLYQDFMNMISPECLFEESFSDGKIIALIREQDDLIKEKIQKKIKEWNCYRIAVIVPTVSFQHYESLKRLLAIQRLQKDAVSIHENVSILDELFLYEEDLLYEIHCELDRLYTKSEGKSWIYHCSCLEGELFSERRMTQLLNQICYHDYKFAPRVNHELINRNIISIPIRRARDKVISMILQKMDMNAFMSGTSPEATIYRASLFWTGILSKECPLDDGVKAIFQLMDAFLELCVGKKQSFEALFQKLHGKGYGMRDGIIPIFLAYRLSLLQDTPILYLGAVEVALDVDSLNNICERPTDYELFVDKQTLEKENYLRLMFELFSIYGGNDAVYTGHEQLTAIVSNMQNWYRSLPQSARNINIEDSVSRLCAKSSMGMEITAFQKVMKELKLNPRIFLLEQLPMMFGCIDEYKQCLIKVTDVKNYLEGVHQYPQESDKTKEDSNPGKNKIVFTNCDGTHIEKYYDPVEEDSTSIFLQNALEEVLEDFGDSLELAQKINVLTHILGGMLTK